MDFFPSWSASTDTDENEQISLVKSTKCSYAFEILVIYPKKYSLNVFKKIISTDH